MSKRPLLRRLTFALPPLLLAVLLHAHSAAAGTTGAPIVSALEDGCPVCAAVRGGMSAPAAPVHVPAPPVLVETVIPRPSILPRTRRPEALVARGPPSSF